MDGLNSENSLTFHPPLLNEAPLGIDFALRRVRQQASPVVCEATTVFTALQTGAVSGSHAASLQMLTVAA